MNLNVAFFCRVLWMLVLLLTSSIIANDPPDVDNISPLQVAQVSDAAAQSPENAPDDPWSSGLVPPNLDLPKPILDFMNAQLCDKKESLSKCEQKIERLNRKFGASQDHFTQLGYLYMQAENYSIISTSYLVIAANIQLLELKDCPHSYEIYGTVALYDPKDRVAYLKNPYTRVSGYPDPTTPLPEGYDVKNLPPGMIREGWSHQYLIVVDHPAPRPRLPTGIGYEFSGACYTGQEKRLESGLVARIYITRHDKKIETARKSVSNAKKQNEKYLQLKKETISKYNELYSKKPTETAPP